MTEQPRLKKEYFEKIRPELMKELGIKNIMAVPKLEKIIINSGLGEAIKDSKIIDEMIEDISVITGQRPIRTKAKKAISNFKIRIGEDIGLKVTLRDQKMWEFLDRLVNIVLPRTKDFRGISSKAFDGRGNYALGIREHNVFPEVDPNKVTRARGIQIIFTISGNSDENSRVLLGKLGMPFQKKK